VMLRTPCCQTRRRRSRQTRQTPRRTCAPTHSKVRRQQRGRRVVCVTRGASARGAAPLRAARQGCQHAHEHRQARDDATHRDMADCGVAQPPPSVEPPERRLSCERRSMRCECECECAVLMLPRWLRRCSMPLKLLRCCCRSGCAWPLAVALDGSCSMIGACCGVCLWCVGARARARVCV
jgi:hypothetical protein